MGASLAQGLEVKGKLKSVLVRWGHLGGSDGGLEPRALVSFLLYCSAAPAAAVPEAALGPGISGRLPVPAAGPGSLAHLEVGPELGGGTGILHSAHPILSIVPQTFEGKFSALKFPFPPSPNLGVPSQITSPVYLAVAFLCLCLLCAEEGAEAGGSK